MKITQNFLVNSLYAYWQQHNQLEIPTVYPETRIDTSKLERWMTLWLQSMRRLPVRGDQPEMTDISLVAHCLCQRQQDLKTLHEMVDGVISTLSGKTIPVRAFDQQGLPVIGFLKLFEPVIRESSRSMTSPQQAGIPHIIVTWDGWSQSLNS